MHTAEDAARYLSEHLNDGIDDSNLYEKSGICPFATKRYRNLITETTKKTPAHSRTDTDSSSR